MVDEDQPVSRAAQRRAAESVRRRRAGESTRVVRGSAQQDDPDDMTEILPISPRHRAAGDEDGRKPGATARPRRRPNYVRRRVFVGLGVIFALLFGMVGWVACEGLSAIHNIERRSGLMPTGERPDKPVEGPMTILLAGSDSRDMSSTAGNSDSMMLVHLPKDRKKVYLISLPRDLWVPIPGHKWAKINAAYANGGPALAVKTLEKLMDVRVDHVAMMNFDGFIKLTDAVGGVTVNNEIESYASGHSFPKGQITLQGDAALAYVRQRKDLPNGDLDRAARQRLVIKAIVSKALSAGVLTNPDKLTTFMEKASKTVALDDTFSDGEVRKTILGLNLTSGSDVRSLMLPIAGYGTSADGQSIDVIDREQLEELSVALQRDDMETYFARHQKDAPLTGDMPEDQQPEGPVPDEGLPLTALPTGSRKE